MPLKVLLFYFELLCKCYNLYYYIIIVLIIDYFLIEPAVQKRRLVAKPPAAPFLDEAVVRGMSFQLVGHEAWVPNPWKT